MSASLPNPLHDLHRQADAEFQPYADLQIVSTFGEPQAEYAAIHKNAAMMDQPQRGIMELTGSDRHPFLNNLITNQVWSKQTKQGISAGQGVYAFFINTRGRIVADMNVLELGDRLLLEMDARQVETVAAAFEKYRFVEQVKISSRVGSLHQIAVYGPASQQILAQVSGESGKTDAPPGLALLGVRTARIFDVDTILWRDDPTGRPGIHLVVPSEAARTLWMNLLARFGQSDQAGRRTLRPVGWAAFNTARIEAGRPLFGIDFDDTVLPAETAQLSRAVSFTKGCYLGQEVVARMHARGQVARQIVGIRMADDSLPIAGAHIFAPDASGNQVGGVTSSTLSPVLSNASIALGLVKKGFNALGSELLIPAEGAMRRATIVQPPFIP